MDNTKISVEDFQELTLNMSKTMENEDKKSYGIITFDSWLDKSFADSSNQESLSYPNSLLRIVDLDAARILSKIIVGFLNSPVANITTKTFLNFSDIINYFSSNQNSYIYTIYYYPAIPIYRVYDESNDYGVNILAEPKMVGGYWQLRFALVNKEN